MAITIYTYKIHTLISAPKIHTDLLWDLTLLFAGLAVLYFVAVFFFRNKTSSNSGKVQLHKAKLSPMISEFLFYEEDATKNEKTNYVNLKIEIRQLLKDDFNRKVLSEILLDLRKDVSGDTQRRLFMLYTDLGLHNDAFEKLKSWRWEIVSKGILELTQMQVQEAYGFIIKFINDKRSTIRKQAEIATATLKHEGINYFLDTTKYKISEWQQLKLLDVIRNQENFQPPLFKVWLTSKNKHVVLFSLRLIKYYRQSDAKVSLIELVKHKDNQIKEEAIQCIKEFNIVEALDTLQTVFWKSTVDIKISILGTIAYIGSQEHIPFLKSIENKESDFSVKNKALGAINTILPESIMPTEGIQDISNYKTPADIVDEDTRSDLDSSTDSKVPIDDSIIDSMAIEEIAKDPITVSRPETSYEEQAENIKDELNVNIDFIPLVIDDIVIKTEQPSEKYNSMEDVKNEKADVLDIDVIFEEVFATESKNEQNQNIAHFEISDLNFVPIVVENEEQENQTFHEQNKEDSLTNILAIEVFYEQVSSSRNEAEREEMGLEVSELNFLPIVTDDNSYLGDESPDQIDQKQPVSIAHIDYNNLLDLEITYEELENQPAEGKTLREETDQDSNNTDLPEEEPKEQDVVSWLMAHNEMRNLELDYDEVTARNSLLDFIPKPLYYNEHEAYMMALLDDLEELGDYREIPLLNELLYQEKVIFIKERISSLIDDFSIDKDRLTNTAIDLEIDDNDSVFSVFEDLFRFCDTEQKLILLDEIIAVGDEKEINFLNNLLEDVEPEICKKASLVLEGLQNKLDKNEPEFASFGEANSIERSPEDETIFSPYDALFEKMENSSSNSTDIFDVNFEISEDFESANEEVEKKLAVSHLENEGSLIDQLWSIPNKIIGKFNG